MEPNMQATFDTVARHLLKQGRRSVIGLNGNCQYRAPNGDKCAVGCLIPDELYSPDMEGDAVCYLLERYPALTKVPLINGFQKLLLDLQGVHDGTSPANWRSTLVLVAKHAETTGAVSCQQAADRLEAIMDFLRCYNLVP